MFCFLQESHGRCPMAAAKPGADIQQNEEEESGSTNVVPSAFASIIFESAVSTSAVAEATLNSKLRRVDQLLWS